MISDVLLEAADRIRGYLTSPATARCYTGELRLRLQALLLQLDILRRGLDTSPALNEPTVVKYTTADGSTWEETDYRPRNGGGKGGER